MLESLLAGRTLVDRYLVLEVIGRGGMGAVYRARDERLGREVALKVITVAAPDAEAQARLRARFHREARAAARLRHQNVVSVFDFGTDPELRLDFLVMELLRGEDLASRVARAGAPPLGEALGVLYQAARGLSAGHRSGLIHRDVKPGNLYLEAADRDEPVTVKVLDFGIAELATDGDATVTHLTVAGPSPFSPAFASPEQLRGEARLTPATDVFSLGAVGYYLLTGERAFTSPEPRQMVVEVSASAAALRRRLPGAPTGLHDVFRRALAPHPDDRYPDAAAFADALASLGPTAVAPRPVESPAPSSGSERPPPVAASAGLPARPRRGGAIRQGLRVLTSFVATSLSVGAWGSAWAAVLAGLQVGDLAWVYGGAAASVLLTPLAVHRILPERGSLRLGIFGSLAGTIAAVFLLGQNAEIEAVLATMFITQLLLSWGTELLTRRGESGRDSYSDVT